MEKAYLGIDAGGTGIKAGLIFRSGEIIFESNTPTGKNWGNEDFLNAVSSLCEKAFSVQKPEAIGIGTPGPIDIENGIILHSANMHGLNNVPLTESLKKKFSVPVFFNNDANCAALGEYHFGAGTGSKNLLVITLGTGLGAGWVLDGKIYNGFQGNGMELGHTTVEPDSKALCGCGQYGCIESYFSASGLLNRYEEMTGRRLANALEFFSLVQSGDEKAGDVLEKALGYFALTLRTAVHTVNPDRIVLVGGLAKSSDLYLEKLKKKVSQIVFPVLWNNLRLETGKNVAGTLGAGSLCFASR